MMIGNLQATYKSSMYQNLRSASLYNSSKFMAYRGVMRRIYLKLKKDLGLMKEEMKTSGKKMRRRTL